MNHQVQIANSIAIFGGKPADYDVIHRTIDMNDLADMSPTSRFFLHHIDVGGKILEKVFGKTITNSSGKKVKVTDILKQHLIGDFDDVPTFADWYSNLNEDKVTKIRNKPKLTAGNELIKAIRKDNILSELKGKDINILLSMLDLTMVASKKKQIPEPAAFIIFGNALGVQLTEKVIGAYIANSTIATVDAFRNLLLAKFDGIPTLSDFAQCITEKPWMASPQAVVSGATIKKKMQEGHKFTRIKESNPKDVLASLEFKKPEKIDTSSILKYIPRSHFGKRRCGGGSSRHRRVMD